MFSVEAYRVVGAILGITHLPVGGSLSQVLLLAPAPRIVRSQVTVEEHHIVALALGVANAARVRIVQPDLTGVHFESRGAQLLERAGEWVEAVMDLFEHIGGCVHTTRSLIYIHVLLSDTDKRARDFIAHHKHYDSRSGDLCGREDRVHSPIIIVSRISLCFCCLCRSPNNGWLRQRHSTGRRQRLLRSWVA